MIDKSKKILMLVESPNKTKKIQHILRDAGYNVTVIWVLCNKDTAVTNNTLRGIGDKSEARKVPDEILNKGHKII